MKTYTLLSRRLFTLGLGAALLFPFASNSALAHEAPCPHCGMAITQDTPTVDNEVALRVGRKRIEYKCVYCALQEAKTEYRGDLTILAPSETKGEPVRLSRAGDKWSVAPTTAVFLFTPRIKHKSCELQSRAFTTQAAADKHIAAHKELLGGAETLSLAQLLEKTGTEKAAVSPPAATTPAPQAAPKK